MQQPEEQKQEEGADQDMQGEQPQAFPFMQGGRRKKEGPNK